LIFFLFEVHSETFAITAFKKNDAVLSFLGVFCCFGAFGDFLKSKIYKALKT
jgi:hypothetical protein